MASTKKEFFQVALEELQATVNRNHAGEVKYTLLAEAAEYRKSQGMRENSQGPVRAPQSGRATAKG